MKRDLKIIFLLLLAAGWAVTGTARADGLAETMKRAAKGDTEAQYELGLIYRDGDGVGQDYGKAGALFTEASQHGHAEAQYELARLYYTGAGFVRDRKKAQALFVLAADHGSAASQYFLGVMYSKGRGVKKNYRKAAYWYDKAARQGHPDADDHLKNLCSDRPSVCDDIK